MLNIREKMVINRRYELLKEIHMSVNSIVFRAFDNLSDKFVIIKFLEKSNYDTTNSELFRREVRSLENIDNEYVIRLIDSGEEIEFYYIVTEQLIGSITFGFESISWTHFVRNFLRNFPAGECPIVSISRQAKTA
ncbi:hypothetical protein [Enterococcus faecium]|uniref:hypothetical protein n=1 Tax=Enterococcus faecium TaxID=1352 RepID=UPI0033905D96